MKRISLDELHTSVSIGTAKSNETEWQLCQPGKYIACVYDSDWYIGNIKDRSDEHKDVFVTFMKRAPNHALSWPRRKDECWIPQQHIICVVQAPSVKGRGARQYNLDPRDLQKILASYVKFLPSSS